MSITEPDQYHGHSRRREWRLILLLLLLAVVSMFCTSQYALRILPTWRVSADMASLIDPDGTIAAYSGGNQIQPVDLLILTPFSFDYLTPIPTNATATKTNTAILPTLTPTRTVTTAPSQTPTDEPTATLPPTKTRIVIYYTASFTRTDAPDPASTATQTFTQTFTPTNTTSVTRTATPTVTATATRTWTHTSTLIPSVTYTRTNSPTPSTTFTPTDTPTPTVSPTSTDTPTPTQTFTPTETLTPTQTFTPTETFTPTQTFTPTDTPLPTPTITMPDCSNNKKGDINIGPGDNNCTTIYSNDPPMVIDLGSTPITAHGDGNWDFIYYERAAHPGIQMDLVILEISADNSTWYTVFDFGGGGTSNSSIGSYPQNDNELIPLSDLIGGAVRTGVGIDIDVLGIPDDVYQYLRITSPPDSGDGCDVDAIEVIP